MGWLRIMNLDLEGGILMFKNFILVMLTVLFSSGTAEAAAVYLKDGGVIKCFFAKQQGETVYVLVNRDTEIQLDRRVVALQKTFKNRKSIGSYRHDNKAGLER